MVRASVVGTTNCTNTVQTLYITCAFVALDDMVQVTCVFNVLATARARHDQFRGYDRRFHVSSVTMSRLNAV
jgi:hypothetical protein